jgi:two-component system NarL family response regulator
MKIRVLLADDHEMFRDALRMTLELAPGIQVVAQASNGQAVLAAMACAPVDVVCMDMRMGGLGGLETTRLLLQRFPQTRVIGLSAHDDPVLVREMMDAGAYGYVLKMDIGRELVQAIQRVHNNEVYLSPSLSTMGSQLARDHHAH